MRCEHSAHTRARLPKQNPPRSKLPDHFSPIFLFFLRFFGLKLTLSPMIPLHRRHSPVSPIIPVHTQKQGGGGVCFRYPFSNVPKKCRRADIPVPARKPHNLECGGLPPLLRGEHLRENVSLC